MILYIVFITSPFKTYNFINIILTMYVRIMNVLLCKLQNIKSLSKKIPESETLSYEKYLKKKTLKPICKFLIV